MIEDGETIFMDSSSTSIAIASHLKNRRNITIISNCLRLAQNLQYSPGMNTYVIGGLYVREIKRAVVSMCQKVVVAVDSTKWNQIARYAFAHLNQVNHIVTDTNAPAETIKQVQAMGIEVRLV
jgi:DeoR/GlpR family transcriptional regulator of sugar metabolism